ncbi:STAS domain-containing protein [Murinocardiopsis flavida]|uniref:STAS domain-containing protein n=1 Tax=Murinocardiopsis flavida TaxID=645275 RepID=UPI001FE6A000|nr:STAS domain-containing protein [Murinocardiopsis flavida]
MSESGPRSAAEVGGRDRFRCHEVVLFPVHGEIDMATAGALHDDLVALLAYPGDPCVIADLSQVGFIDASGLRALVAANRAFLRAGRHLVLAEPSAQASRLLDALHIERIFDIYPIVEMAAAHVTAKPPGGEPGGPH